MVFNIALYTKQLMLILSIGGIMLETEGFHSCSSTATVIRGTNRSSIRMSSSTDDILKPKYDIEKTPLRIGHGFDIHRMIPLEEAGQPVVIGGVTIDHKDQKVRTMFVLFIIFEKEE